MAQTIDTPTAVANARTWANEMIAWKDCTMVQRLMAKQILTEVREGLFEIDNYNALVALRDQWRERQKPTATYVWMIEQLENCLGLRP